MHCNCLKLLRSSTQPNAELVLIGAADEELGNAHAPNESVQIDHIEMLIESLVKTLKNF